MLIHTRKDMEFFKREKIFLIKWSLRKYINFLYKYFTGKLEMPKIDGEYTCYFVSSGTWGAYELPNTIYICPILIEKSNMSIKEIIEHEIRHIKHEDDVKGMTHKGKEEYINSKK